MRVLQATDCYPPPLLGGRDLHVRMLSHELARRGHEVEVVTLAGQDGPRVESDGDILVHRIGGWGRALSRFYEDPERPFHPTVPDPGMIRPLAEVIRQKAPDVVHAHSWILHSLLPLLPSAGTRLVVTMHDYGLVCAKTSFVHKADVCSGPAYVKCVTCSAGQYGPLRATAIATGLNLMHRSHRRVDSYIAVSKPVAHACRSLADRGERDIEVIPPFLSDDSFPTDALPRPSFVPARGDYIMFAGALGPHKGVDVLLDAWGGFDPAVPLVLVGLHRQDTPRHFPEGVRVMENVPHEDVLRAWAHCAVAVVPSRWPEPFGLVALEAMAAGRAVVASAVGALPDLLQNGRAGVLVPPGDALALREAIVQLLGDPVRRAKLGEVARQRATGYSASAIVPQIEDVYHGALAGPARSPARILAVRTI